MSEHDRLRELGRELPWERPDAARREEVRSSILVAATEAERRPRTRWPLVGGAFAAGAVAAAAVALLVAGGPTDRETRPAEVASVEATPAATYERHVTPTPTGVDEVVRVHHGAVRVAVGALRVGDHVRVATRDAEVEGEGRYEVVVHADEIQTVRVQEGRATVRVNGQRAVFLAAGQSWQASVIAAQVDLVPAPPAQAEPGLQLAPESQPQPAADVRPEHAAEVRPQPAAEVRPQPQSKPERARERSEPRPHLQPQPQRSGSAETARSSGATTVVPVETRMPAVTALTPTGSDPSPTATDGTATAASQPQPSHPPVPTGPSEVEKRFQAGWALLKAGKHAEAALQLGAAADAGGDDPLAADARYFQATALAKAGRKTEAERALVAFLDRAPRSIRRGRAAVTLARLIAERGDVASARRWFESAIDDPDPGVAASARAGIAGLPR